MHRKKSVNKALNSFLPYIVNCYSRNQNALKKLIEFLLLEPLLYSFSNFQEHFHHMFKMKFFPVEAVSTFIYNIWENLRVSYESSKYLSTDIRERI